MGWTTRIRTLSGSVVGGLLYVGCLAWGALFPAHAMRTVWALLPGYSGLSAGTFALGLEESLVFGAVLGWLVTEVRRLVVGAAW